MKKSMLVRSLVVVVVLQLGVLVGSLVQANLPMWVGTEIRVLTQPVDPRSLFRGNYARLSYEFDRLPVDLLPSTERIRVGEVVYAQLEAGEDGLYSLVAVSFEKPSQGVFLRGRITRSSAPYRVHYGLEAFFAEKDKALQLERDLRGGGVAVIAVAANGRSTLVDVQALSDQ